MNALRHFNGQAFCVKRRVVAPFSRSFASQPLRRSYLYVPSAQQRMLDKSLQSTTDVVVYDLEDSVPPLQSDKESARTRLKEFLSGLKQTTSAPREIAVRINGPTTLFWREDITEIVSQPSVQTVVLPKINSTEDLDLICRCISAARPHQFPQVNIVSSVESARAMFNLGSISSWKAKDGLKGGVLRAILFAAEDYCADTGIIRTNSRRELLFTRSQIVVTAKAFGLEAIDMVCVDYKNHEILSEECVDGRQLGFTGKQAIHPGQLGIINATFVPTADEISRAAKILEAMDEAHASQIGAVGLDGKMIDAPMIKQAERVISMAKSAGLQTPSSSSS